MREVEVYANSIAAAIEGILPQSVVKVTVKDSRYGNSIFIQFKLWKQSPNKIPQNDPSYTHINIYNSHKEDGSLRTDMKLEMSMGNTLRGYNAVTLERKIGFRGVKSGDSVKVLRALTNYFKKLDAAAKKHQEALSEALDRYISLGSIKMGSLRSLEMRIARLEKLSTSKEASNNPTWDILFSLRRRGESGYGGIYASHPISELNLSRREVGMLRSLERRGYIDLFEPRRHQSGPSAALTKKGIEYVYDEDNNPIAHLL